MSRIIGENRSLLLIGGVVSAIILVCGCSIILAMSVLLTNPPRTQEAAQQATTFFIAPTATSQLIVRATPAPTGGNSGNNVSNNNLPTGVNASNAERLSLTPGTTSLIKVDAPIAAHSLRDYVIGIEAGQTLILDLSSREGNYLSINVLGVTDGNIVKSLTAPIILRPVVMSSSQDYVIRINNTGKDTVFTLLVGLPIRINFATGATSTTLQGPIFGAKGSTDLDYIINGQAGQTMTVSVMSPNNDVFLSIYGVEDDQYFVRAYMKQTTWTMQLPSHQDYVIQLQAWGGTTTYSLVTTLTN